MKRRVSNSARIIWWWCPLPPLGPEDGTDLGHLGWGPAVPMQHAGEGWHELVSPDSKAGTLYKFQLERGGLKVPDPASRYQPSDVHGPSEVFDPDRYDWKDNEWKGRPWEECVLYEPHLGTFTPQGTFLGATERLDWLADLGITAIEIMPVGGLSRKAQLGIWRRPAVCTGLKLRRA
jgi:hypothetical protein